MMKSINVIIDDIQHEVVTKEEEESSVPNQHVRQDVLDKGTNITLPREDEN